MINEKRFNPPNNFRRIVRSALEELNAPEDIVAHVGDMGIEDEVVGPIYYAAGTLYQMNLELEGDFHVEDIFYAVEGPMHALLKNFKNPMNWGPGETPGDGAIDAEKLIDAVVEKIMA